MKESLHKQLLGKLNLKETEELLEIWQNRDTTEWIDEVFEVVEEILMQRLGELPPRPNPAQDLPRDDDQDKETDIEAELQILEGSKALELLDQAMDYAWEDEPEKALAACQAAQADMPDNAAAFNYLGIIYDTLGQVESAIEAYQQAVQRSPRFSAARQNLRNARVRLEGEEYHRATNLTAEETQALCDLVDQADETDIVESGELLPDWAYLDEAAYLLPGWPGYRTRPRRSGYDQLDSSYELSRIEGILIRRMFTFKLRTRKPGHLLFMTFVGLFLCIPLLFVRVIVLEGAFRFLPVTILFTPYWIGGVTLLVNVVLSLMVEDVNEEESGEIFF